MIYDLAIYVLSYNCSGQFALWLHQFKHNVDNDLNYKIYLINNSDDIAQIQQYDNICKVNKIDQIKYNNIGINPGRHAAALHFDKSNHTHMIFFEDDMLLISKSDDVCRSGFTTKVDNILAKCINIVETESVDFLKLSFTEVFGDNSKNWAWVNMSDSQRQAYFGSLCESNARTEISHIGNVNGTSYAVGNFHFCNWPILCSKNGSRKIFLDPEVRPTYEQTLMVNTFIKMFNKKVRGSCLLASPISHKRVFNYSKRKEC